MPIVLKDEIFDHSVQVLYSIDWRIGHLHVTMQNVVETEVSVINVAERLIEFFRRSVLPTLSWRYRMSWRATYYVYVRPSAAAGLAVREAYSAIVSHKGASRKIFVARRVTRLPPAIRPMDLPGSRMMEGRRL
jgi:hypothetical protein